MPRSTPQPHRRVRHLLAALLTLPLLTLAACAGGSAATGKPPPPDGSVGTTLDATVPSAVLDAPLTDSTGRATSLAAFRGKVLVLGDSMTLCQEICPLLSANFTSMARETVGKGLGNDVVFVQLTVDPQRDTPVRLQAYRQFFAPAPPNWVLLTGSAADVDRIWKYFGVSYDRAAEKQPPATDWLTGKPLTYDVEHSDIVLTLDRRQHERFLINAAPNARDNQPPTPLRSYLSDEGQNNLNSPDPVFSWTPAQLKSAVEWVLGRRY